MPYDYYSMPFCKPPEIVNKAENLGEILHGSMIANSPYDIFMGKSDFKVLCRVELTKRTAGLLAMRIKEDYRVHMIMDNLPAATKMIREMPDGKTITMYDREDSFEGSRIVGFEVEPLSVKHQYKGAFTTDITKLNLLTVPVGPDLPPQPVQFSPGPGAENELVYTYDVKWEYSD